MQEEKPMTTACLGFFFLYAMARDTKLRGYVLQNLLHIEYRTLACATREEATSREYELKRTGRYLFHS
ncbi:hypothetical protein BJN34_04670 [Cupriavidus necator]|uniref:Uncharacterized protein n=1 Tax=Cupriavidus necator TaxID=106590 RepID=A0A1U9UKS4_CUPNE|nr:hypothetical protein BJN34_04670 [Cupriavidus necator]